MNFLYIYIYIIRSFSVACGDVLADSEKRHFRRYGRSATLSIRQEGAKFSAQMADYSATGIGLLIAPPRLLAPSSLIDVDVDSPSIRARYSVIWSTGPKAGIRRESPIEGLISDYRLADILIGLQRSEITGVLEIKSGEAVKKIWVEKGDMVFAASNVDADRLGDILLSEGVITQAQYDHSVEILKATGKRQGRILVERGYLTPRGLVDAVKRQVEIIIKSIFRFREGSFVFREGPLPTDEIITLNLSAANLIYRGIISIEDEGHIRSLSPALDSVPRLSTNPLDLFQSIDPEETDCVILGSIDCKKTARDMVKQLPYGEPRVLKGLCALMATNVVEIGTGDCKQSPDISPEDLLNRPRQAEEKRLYRRFKKRVKFNLFHKWMPYSAELVDYSPTGLCVRVDGQSNISEGEEVELKISSPALPRTGTVLWRKGALLGIGIDMCTGHVEDFLLSDILVSLQAGGKTGELEIKSGKIEKSLYLENGRIVSSSSNDPVDALERLLLEKGFIDKGQFEMVAQFGKAFGKNAGEMVVLRPEVLAEAVPLQTERVALSFLDVSHGKFCFREGKAPPTKTTVHAGLTVSELVYYGIKKRELPPRIISKFFPPGVVIDFSSLNIGLPKIMAPDDIDKILIGRIDGKKTVEEVIFGLPFDSEEIYKSLYALFSIRLIDILEKEEEPSPEDVEGFFEKTMGDIDYMYEKHEALGYYGVLGIANNASTADIKKAYYKVAKDYHPDRHFNLTPEVKGKLSKIFSYISVAYATITDPKKRKNYDALLSAQTSKGPASKGKSAEHSYAEGRKEFGKGNFETAERLFGEAAYLDPKGLYHYHYAKALNQNGKFKVAEKAVRRALDDNPDNVEFNVEAGWIYLNLKLAARAKGCFDKALKLSPSSKSAIDAIKKKYGKIE